MTVLRSVGLFIIAAVAEIGGAYLIWQGVREKRGAFFIAAGVIALGLYGFVATFQPSPYFGRILAATAVCSLPAPSPGGSSSTYSDPTAMT